MTFIFCRPALNRRNWIALALAGLLVGWAMLSQGWSILPDVTQRRAIALLMTTMMGLYLGSVLPARQLVRTFSMVFHEPEFNEEAFAQRIAQRFGTEHTAYEVTGDEVLHELPDMIWAMDQPSIDGINTYFVSKVTRQSGTIVALSGVGGDEVFGGYQTFALLPRLYRAAQVAHAVPGGAWMVDQALRLRARRRTSRIALAEIAPGEPRLGPIRRRPGRGDRECRERLRNRW